MNQALRFEYKPVSVTKTRNFGSGGCEFESCSGYQVSISRKLGRINRLSAGRLAELVDAHV